MLAFVSKQTQQTEQAPRRFTVHTFDLDGNNPVTQKTDSLDSAMGMAHTAKRWVIWTPDGDVLTWDKR